MVEAALEARLQKQKGEIDLQKRRQEREGEKVERADWTSLDTARRKRNKAAKTAHQISVKAYQDEVKKSKLTKRPVLLSKPGRIIIEKERPKPWLVRRREPESIPVPRDEELAQNETDEDSEELSD